MAIRIRIQKNRFFHFLLMCLFMESCVVGQKLNEQNQGRNLHISVRTKFAEVDNLGRIYVIDDKNRLINYKPDFSEQYRYANNRNGLISSIDVTNPLKIIAFYDDFNHVRIFDNTLTIITELSLADKFVDVTACGTSNDGHLWIYDPTQFKLLKINENAQILAETSNVNDFGMYDVSISSIREKSNFVVLMDRSKGFYFFDNLGQYIYHYATSNVSAFQFEGTLIIYYNKEGLNIFNIVTKENQTMGIPEEINSDDLKFILFQSEHYYAVYPSGVLVSPLR